MVGEQSGHAAIFGADLDDLLGIGNLESAEDDLGKIRTWNGSGAGTSSGLLMRAFLALKDGSECDGKEMLRLANRGKRVVPASERPGCSGKGRKPPPAYPRRWWWPHRLCLGLADLRIEAIDRIESRLFDLQPIADGAELHTDGIAAGADRDGGQI
jgi:hypothetical protein